MKDDYKYTGYCSEERFKKFQWMLVSKRQRLAVILGLVFCVVVVYIFRFGNDMRGVILGAVFILLFAFEGYWLCRRNRKAAAARMAPYCDKKGVCHVVLEKKGVRVRSPKGSKLLRIPYEEIVDFDTNGKEMHFISRYNHAVSFDRAEFTPDEERHFILTLNARCPYLRLKGRVKPH